MPTRAWLEIRLALIGTLRLARGDRGGLACFDRSADGFWRSFRAAVISYPLYLVLLSMRVTVAEWERSGAFLIITVETIAYVIAWTAFPLLMLIVAQRIGRPHRFFDFMVPYNWSQLPQSALFVLVGLEPRAVCWVPNRLKQSRSLLPSPSSSMSGLLPASRSTRPRRPPYLSFSSTSCLGC